MATINTGDDPPWEDPLFEYFVGLHETITQAIRYWQIAEMYVGRPDQMREALTATITHDLRAYEPIVTLAPAHEEPERIAA